MKYKQEKNDKLFVLVGQLKSDLQNIHRKDEDNKAEKKMNMEQWKALNVNDCQCSSKTGKNVKFIILSIWFSDLK